MLKTKETELVDFLSNLNKEHIDELIDILTDFGKGRVALNGIVKEVLLGERKFSILDNYSKEIIELIITEFQLFSGNSIVNQFRDELVSYEETVNGVYSYVFKEEPKDPLKDKEKSILNRVVGNGWENSDFEYRFKKSKEKVDILNQKKSDIFDAILSIISSVPNEAYRVTIPFVVQISWLKMKYGFYENNGFPIIKKHKEDRKEESRKIDKDNISTLNQLVSCVPDLLIKKEISQNNIAVVNVPLEQLQPAKDGSGLLGFIMGEKGIEKQARIFEPEKLQNLVNTGVLMNLASTLVAQKHLADINQKLNDLNKGIKDIKKFLENERDSKIRAAYREASRIYNSLTTGKNDMELSTLKRYLDDVQQVYDQVLQEISDIAEETKRLKSIRESFELLNKLNQSCNQIKLCCNTIMAGCSVLFMHDKKQAHLDRMNHFYKATKDFLDGLEKNINNTLESLFERSKSILNFNSTELANFAFVKNRKFNFHNSIHSSLKELDLFSKSLLENKSLQIQVELENGIIKEAYL